MNVGNNVTIEYEVTIGDNFSSTGNGLKVEELIVIGNGVTVNGNNITIKKEAGTIGDFVTITADVSEAMLVVCHSSVTTSIVVSDQATHVPGHPGDTLGACPVAPKKKYTDKYEEKLSVYLIEQIKSKLDEMHSSDLISDSKYSKMKETQKFIQKNIGQNLK